MFLLRPLDHSRSTWPRRRIVRMSRGSSGQFQSFGFHAKT
jgi:hypothetical protein